MARRHTPEQVIAKVRQGQKMLNDGHPMIEVVKELQVTEATWVPVAEPVRVREERRGVQTDQGAGEGERATQTAAGGEGTGHRHPQRGGQGKILSPEPRRRAVRMAVEKFGASERFACKILGQNRSAFRKKKPDTSFEENTASRRPTRHRDQAPDMGMAESPLVPARPGVGWNGAQQQARTPALARGRPRL